MHPCIGRSHRLCDYFFAKLVNPFDLCLGDSIDEIFRNPFWPVTYNAVTGYFQNVRSFKVMKQSLNLL
jgi:hypothetical protein